MLDKTGVVLLVEAILRKALKDYDNSPDEVERFLRSSWFILLCDAAALDASCVMEQFKKHKKS